jgi:uncharacterized protein (TIGR03435 family)
MVSLPNLRKRVFHIMSQGPNVSLTIGRRALLIAGAVLALTLPIGFGAVHGQPATLNSGTPKSQPANQALQFDVVSIKPTPPSDDKVLIELLPDGDTFHAFHGATVRMILQAAFDIEDDRIIGGPSWMNSDRYDIEAKVTPEDAPRLDKMNGEERRAMFIPVLTERFHLKYHHETRERPMYALVVAKGGPKLTKGVPEGAPEDPAKEHHKIMTVPGHIEADSVPMYVLADQLNRLHSLGRIVVDKTGLTGDYNFTLKWTPDNSPFSMMESTGNGLGQADNGKDAAQLSMFTAIQEQLGLKIESEKDSVDVIVIDQIDQPSQN